MREGALKALEARVPHQIERVMEECGQPIRDEIAALMNGRVEELHEQIVTLHGKLDEIGRQIAAKHRCLLGLSLATGQQHQGEIVVMLPHRPHLTVRATDAGPAEEAWRSFALALERDPGAQNDPRLAEEG